jgi:predicted dehydrogenase
MTFTTNSSAIVDVFVRSPLDAPAVRWGILGAGWIAGSFAEAVTTATASRVVAVGSRDESKARAFADEHLGVDATDAHIHSSYESLVANPDVDIIYVATPHSHHHEHALLAINAGKHILVEKAFTRNRAEAEDVFAAAKARGVFVMEAMWTRFLPHIAAIREIIGRGDIGRVIAVTADHGQYFDVPAEHRLLNPDLAGGALLDLGVYPVSFAHDILGAPNSITAVGHLTPTGVDGQVSMVFDYPERCQAVLQTTLWSATPTAASISGTDGRIEIAGAFYAPTSFTVIRRDGDRKDFRTPPVTGLAFEAAEVARCVSAGATESDRMTWQGTLDVLGSLDTVREQVGVAFPGEAR